MANKKTDETNAKSLAKTALMAINDLHDFAEANEMPEELTKAIVRTRKKTEAMFGKVIVWQELNS